MDPGELRKLLNNPDYNYDQIPIDDITPNYVLKELETLANWFGEREYWMRFARLKRTMYFIK